MSYFVLRQAFGQRYLPLPSRIYTGAKFNVLPIEMSTVFENRMVAEFGEKNREILKHQNVISPLNLSNCTKSLFM